MMAQGRYNLTAELAAARANLEHSQQMVEELKNDQRNVAWHFYHHAAVYEEIVTDIEYALSDADPTFTHNLIVWMLRRDGYEV